MARGAIVVVVWHHVWRLSGVSGGCLLVDKQLLSATYVFVPQPPRLRKCVSALTAITTLGNANKLGQSQTIGTVHWQLQLVG
ncbi:hypothetical protein J6590_091674 [Homalodisca vitripennis]|nr:hypothetical protein J6590_091674 [Homalodisca vitripennis]